MSAISVVLADDHHIVRQGLRALFESTADLQVVGESGDGLDVLNLVERLQPNVLVLDLMMPGLNGLEVTRQLADRVPKTRILILTMHANEGYVLEALRNGAAGYVLKDSPMGVLLQAVRDVAAGRRYLCSPLSERAIATYLQASQPTAVDPYDTLTSREREVLQLAAEGHSNAQIAARLFISARTVETHRANVMRKLGLAGQTDLVRYAIRRGILPME